RRRARTRTRPLTRRTCPLLCAPGIVRAVPTAAVRINNEPEPWVPAVGIAQEQPLRIIVPEPNRRPITRRGADVYRLRHPALTVPIRLKLFLHSAFHELFKLSRIRLERRCVRVAGILLGSGAVGFALALIAARGRPEGCNRQHYGCEQTEFLDPGRASPPV